MNAVSQSLQQAVEYHQSGDLDRAEVLYQDIVRVDPHQADALHLLGLVSHQRCRYETAVEYVNRAIAANSLFAPYHNTLGAAYRAQERYDEAVECFREAIRLDAGCAEAHFNLATLSFEVGAFDEAMTHYELALETNQDYGVAWRDVGLIFAMRGEDVNAIACYEQAIQRQPDLADTYLHLAKLLNDGGRLDEAAVSYRGALKLNPQYAETIVNPHRILSALVELADVADSIRPDDKSSDGAAQPSLQSLLHSYRQMAEPIARFDRICEANRRASDVLEHMLGAYESAQTFDAPFTHFCLENLFPEDFLDEMLDHLPSIEYYDELIHRDAMLPNGHSARLKFELNEKNIASLPQPLKSFWLDCEWVFRSEKLKFANFAKFDSRIKATVNPVLFRDIAGYQILPRPDIPEKKVTTQFYLPQDDNRPHLGTWLYTKEGDDKEGDDFQKVKQFPFKKNTGYSFLVSDTSWHGVDQTNLCDGPRDTLMLIHLQGDQLY